MQCFRSLRKGYGLNTSLTAWRRYTSLCKVYKGGLCLTIARSIADWNEATAEMAAAAVPPFISYDKVRQLVSVTDLISPMRHALELFSAWDGGVVQPVRSSVAVAEQDGVLLAMPAYSRGVGLGAKMVTMFANNAERGIPSHQGIVLVFCPETGTLQALVDGVSITAMRTAAASACAVEALLGTPRPHRRLIEHQPPQVLCIVGTGAQALSHAEALCFVSPFSEVRVWGRNPDRARKCAREIGGTATAYDSLEAAVRGAAVVVTATLATKPVLCGKWLDPGTIVCCVGACRPDWRELDDDIMHNAVVLVDSRAAAMKESGDIILSKAEIFAEIGQVLSKRVHVPFSSGKIIVFKSLGMAIEDVASATLVFQRYQEEQRQQRQPAGSS